MAIWIFKAAFPEGLHPGEKSWAEGSFGTKLWCRDVTHSTDCPLLAPTEPTGKILDEFERLSSVDPSRFPWNSEERMNRCFAAYFEQLNRLQSGYLDAFKQAQDRMVADAGCSPVPTGYTNCPNTTDQVALYTHTQYEGRCVLKGVGTFNDATAFAPLSAGSASSIRVGANVKATLCSRINLGGTCVVYTSDDNDFNGDAIGNDTVASFRIELRAGVPGAPTNVTAVAGNGQAGVSWSHPASSGGSPITQYTVVASPGGATATTGGGSPSVTVDGLANGTTYTFLVRATNASGTGPDSAPSNPVTPMTTPGAPTNVVAVAGDARADVSWSPPASDGGSPITGYTVVASPGLITASAGGGSTGVSVTGLTNGTAYTFTVRARNAVDYGPESLPSAPVTPAAPVIGGRYTPLTPARILDTRDGTGGFPGAVGAGGTIDVQITGRGGVPTTGVAAVAMNVTVTQPTTTGWLTLYPAGQPRPLAANLNFVTNQTVPNLVVVKVGTGGKVALYNSGGSTHAIFDVAGWYSDTGSGNDGRFESLVPARILDTRNGTGGGKRLGPGESLDLHVAGQGGVPAGGAGAAVLNVAVTGTTATSFLTVYPTGQPRPLAANLNFVSGDTVSNRVMAKLGSGGKLTVYNHAGAADVIVDVNGYYTDASVSGTNGTYNPLVPARILDTRYATSQISGMRLSGTTAMIQVTGQGGVPATGVSAVILNVTVTQPGAGGYLTMFPAGSAQPLVSDLNYAGNETRPNLVVVKVGAEGKVGLYTYADAHVVVDVAGWFS